MSHLSGGSKPLVPLKSDRKRIVQSILRTSSCFFPRTEVDSCWGKEKEKLKEVIRWNYPVGVTPVNFRDPQLTIVRISVKRGNQLLDEVKIRTGSIGYEQRRLWLDECWTYKYLHCGYIQRAGKSILLSKSGKPYSQYPCIPRMLCSLQGTWCIV